MERSAIRESIGLAIMAGDSSRVRDILSQYLSMFKLDILPGVRDLDYQLSEVMIHSPDNESAVRSCRELFALGANANASSYSQAQVGYISLAAKRSLELTKLFVEHGARINHDLCGKPACWAMISATFAGKLDVIQYLVSQGAVVNFVNVHGMSPMNFAKPGSDVHAYLLSIGAKPGAELPRDHLPVFESKPDEPRQTLHDHLSEYFDVEPYPVYEPVPGDPPIKLWRSPRWEGGEVAIITDGMSSVPMPGTSGPRYVELILFFDPRWPLDGDRWREDRNRWPLDWLWRLARLPYERQEGYRSIEIIDNGNPPRPFYPGLPFCSMLLRTHPDPDREWARWKRPDGQIVELLMMSPLLPDERQYAINHGMDVFSEEITKHHHGDIFWNERPSTFRD